MSKEPLDLTSLRQVARMRADHGHTFDPATVLHLIDRLEAAEARVEKAERVANTLDHYANHAILSGDREVYGICRDGIREALR